MRRRRDRAETSAAASDRAAAADSGDLVDHRRELPTTWESVLVAKDRGLEGAGRVRDFVTRRGRRPDEELPSIAEQREG